jgi:hypothetical protein
MDDAGVSRAQATRTIVLAVMAVVVLISAYAALNPKWEYATLKLFPEREAERVDKGAFASTTINLEHEQFAKLGAQGWELVSSSLEHETAYPNFGRSEYVTGLQPNVRPQALLLIFKRQKFPWR